MITILWALVTFGFVVGLLGHLITSLWMLGPIFKGHGFNAWKVIPKPVLRLYNMFTWVLLASVIAAILVSILQETVGES